jgi:glycerate-2-kinase
MNFVIGNNLLALESARERAEGLGYNSIILSSRLEGKASNIARFLSMIAKEIQQSGNPVRAPACIISGGETTVRVVGSGKGGRNQELALSFAIYVNGINGIEFLSAATDGIDGPTDACGAIVDGGTAERARALGLSPQEYLQDNNSYSFHKKVGTILYTGPTHTNVGDIETILCR